MDTAELNVKFQDVFGAQPDATFFSPGRINLIGEHTDYNGGHVFPAAITLGTYGAARKRDDNKLRFYSANFEEVGIVESRLDELVYKKEDNWTNYAKGVLKFLGEEGHAITSGMDVFVYGNIPNGSGLSSSASLELLIGIIAQELFDLKLERVDLVKIGKRTENEFIGVNSGIMDQFAIGMGAENKAIYLDTNTLVYDLVPLDLGDNVIVIMNTNKRRELADSNTTSVAPNARRPLRSSTPSSTSRRWASWTRQASTSTPTSSRTATAFAAPVTPFRRTSAR